MNARWGWLLVPSVLVFAGLLIASQFEIFRYSFYQDLGYGRLGTEFGFANFAAVFRNSFYLRSIWVTLKVSAWATLFVLLLGYPLAYAVARMRSKWAMVSLAGVLTASFVAVPVKVLGIVIIFSKEGWLNTALLKMHIVSEPITLLGNVAGVVVGLIYYSIAFAVLLLYSIIRTIPVTLEEAARIHGCSSWGSFRRVVYPLSVPGLITVGMTVFNLSMGGFAAAALLGAGRVLTVPVLIYQSIFVETRYATASTLSVILLVLVAAINILAVAIIAIWRQRRHGIVRRFLTNKDEVAVAGAFCKFALMMEKIGDGLRRLRAAQQRRLNFAAEWGRQRGIHVRGLRVLNVLLIPGIFLFLFAPLVVVAAASFNGGSSRAGTINFPPHRISFDWYLQTPADHFRAFGISIVLAAAASLMALVLALPVGLALARGQFPAKQIIAAVLRVPLQIPFVIIGISFLYVYIAIGQNFGLVLANTAAGLIVAHVFVLTPYVIGSVTAVLERLNVEIEEAALVHGANRWRAFYRVTLPVIMPGIFAGTIYAFMVSFGDVPIALFLTSPSFVPLPMLIYQSMQVDFDATLLSTSTAVMLVGLGLLLVVQRAIGLDALVQAEPGAA